MNSLLTIEAPVERDLLVAFYDLDGFTRIVRSHEDREIFDAMAAMFELAGDIVEEAGGVLVKVIGDAALIVFPGEEADAGVRALFELKARTEAFLRDRGMALRATVKAHVGRVVCGLVGPRRDKRFDVYGREVNRAAVLASGGLALTPEAFRRLSPETRRRFKKHTPPVRYIPVEEAHRD